MIFTASYIYKEGKKIYQLKRAYFTGFWNLLEFSLIVLTVTALGLFFRRMILVKTAVASIHNNPGKFVSFNKVVQWDTMFSAVSSIVVFLSCLKGLRILRYNKTISILSATLQGCAKPLAAFSVIFLVFFMAFAIFAYILFMPHLEKFSTFVTTLESVMALLLGDFDFKAIQMTNPVLGRLWFVLIMLFGTMYIMNVFLAIIMDTYSAVTEDLASLGRDHEIVDFMVNKLLVVFGHGDGGQKALLASITEQERLQQQRSEQAERKDEERRERKLKRRDMMSRFNGSDKMIREKSEYFTRLDGEIEEKFAQLDTCLEDFWMDISNQQHQQPLPSLLVPGDNVRKYSPGSYSDGSSHLKRSSSTAFTKRVGFVDVAIDHGGLRKTTPFLGFENGGYVADYEDERVEIMMQRDLQKELEKWS